ncbi:MAG: methyltransferase domain-containing protein [Chitinivibrionales bacterium]|nr:methyltransferase domain-containing protein [Chitinivibrionales bacterium]
MRWKKRDIIKYYKDNAFAYGLWGKNMHYGYWDETTKTQREASLRFNEVVAETAKVTKDDHVLDAGCGVGGCSIFLATTFGCRVTGITICPNQVERARKNAKKAGVADLCEFHEMDYEHTRFDDKSFSVVWGFESICYAESKAQFIAESSRVLKSNGRLVVADGFASREHYEGKDKKLMQRWLDGWFVNHLNTPGQFANFAKDSGFSITDYRNVTRQAFKTSKLMLYVSLPFLPLHLLDKIIFFQHPCDALYNQYFAMKKGLWEYGIFYAEK